MTVMKDDIDNTRVIGIAATGAFLVAALVYGLYAIYLKMDMDREQSYYSVPMKLRDYKSEQATQLNGYGWVDQGKTVRIPIDRAMELTLRDINKNAATQGGKE